MVEKENPDAAIPDVQDRIDLEDAVENLRNGIKSDCLRLLEFAKDMKNTKPKNNAFRFEYWESEINKIRTAWRTTHNLEELGELRNKCAEVRKQMEKFRR